MVLDLLAAPRGAVASTIRSIFAADRLPGEQYTDPAGDPGLFGPDSVAWRVHADVSMFVAGVSALMLQALHPLAIAGVFEHSNFREEPLHRLGRTASFVSATTFASTEVAERMIAMVRRMHDRVHGVAPDGRPYSANDPALLRWIHVAEVVSFVNAHRRYGLPPVCGVDVDRYFDETALVAERLGATEVPRSSEEVRRYLREVRGELVAGDQAREAMRFLARPLGSDPAAGLASALVYEAGLGLLPGWARRLHGEWRPPGWELTVVRPAMAALLMTLRLAVGPSPMLQEARRRATGG